MSDTSTVDDIQRKNIPDKINEAARDPWIQALSNGLRTGVRKGRLAKDDASILWGIIQRPLRRAVEERNKRHEYLDILARCKEFVTVAYQSETGSKEQPSWFHMPDWIADHLPQIHLEVSKLMIRFPIPQ
jgi:hypothetical protein